MSRIVVRAVVIIGVLTSWSQHALAAGACAAPAITNTAVDTTNGPWTCHISDDGDKVEMKASATDTDGTSYPCACQAGNRINLDATTWAVSDGNLDRMTGATNKWKASNSIGSKTLTVTFKDMDDGTACDDDDVVVQKTLIAFKVGAQLATSGGNSITYWEDSPSGGGFSGTLASNHILTSNPNPATGGANSVATWMLKTNPASTPIKKSIHAWTHAKGFAGNTAGRVYGVTTDSDWFDGGATSLNVSISLGLVTFAASHDLSNDDNVSTLSAGAAFGSQLHTDYTTCKISLVSDTTTGPTDTKTIDHSPGDAQLIGEHSTSKQAEWEIYYSMQKKTSSGNWAAAEVDIQMQFEWTIPSLPWYAN